MALQTGKNRYRYIRKLFFSYFTVADADTAALCSLEGAALQIEIISELFFYFIADTDAEKYNFELFLL